jgi:hypothetical protein
MMGIGGATRPEEQQRVRQAWMDEDSSVWDSPASLVPPVIDGPAGRVITRPARGSQR